ncbi:IS110 family transposase [Rhizobium sp. AB2/73]|uniref:IS110 family transposase n=1 Tax=Rhizobium sp. AB2/73 TaxID=2795216 RepID=UPI001C60793D|nr:IS110 family transposase [Rhizobium sp. AB2/73]QYA11901.1 IS110 family transposase [Rhizobium sp. AB2/73]UEQ82168.1 IS110 family transposase [Rhizobium sp. AB2/73]
MSRLTIGIDLAKNVFQVHGIDGDNRVVIAQKLRRAHFLPFFAKLEPCLIGMEACASAHHWARELTGMGHEVKLMAPTYVKPYVKRGKNDMVDAEAICEAVTRPTMRFVPIKTASQQSILMVHKSRALLIRQRTMLVNALRGHLTEIGIVAPVGIERTAELVGRVLAHDPTELDVPPLVIDIVVSLAKQIDSLTAEVRTLEAKIREWHRTSEASRRLATIPGVGVITATALAATVTDASVFRSGRELAAWLGLTPRSNSSGGKERLGRITKAGNRYLRTLLIVGATAVLRHVRHKMHGPLIEWVRKLLLTKSARLTTVALANKMARIAWAVMARRTVYANAVA